MAHCVTKKSFAFGTVTGTNYLRGDLSLTLGFDAFLRDKRVDPSIVDLVTIASCAGHSFVITRRSLKESQRKLSAWPRAHMPSMVPSVMAHTSTTTTASWRMVFMSLSVCELAFQLAKTWSTSALPRIRSRWSTMGCIVTLIWGSPSESWVWESCTRRQLKWSLLRIQCRLRLYALQGSHRKSFIPCVYLSNEAEMLAMPRKQVGKIFKASPLLRPRPTAGPAASSLPPISEAEIVDDDDTQMTGGSTGSDLSGAASSEPKATTGRRHRRDARHWRFHHRQGQGQSSRVHLLHPRHHLLWNSMLSHVAWSSMMA